MRIKTYSYYDDFPDNKPVMGKPYINCYFGDFCAKETIAPNSIAILLEPRSIEKLGYEYIEKNPYVFKYIFTHDSRLLSKFSNTRFLVWGTTWCTADVPKTKGISMISSHKECCELHKVRTEIARHFDKGDKVDCFGTFRDPSGKTGFVNTYDAHAEYKFAIAMENYIDDFWFTEKILNCFSTKTVPIYYGARSIGDFFNADGIIQVSDYHDIINIAENLNVDAEYDKRKKAIEDNFERVKPYGERWRDRFFKEYGSLLEEII